MSIERLLELQPDAPPASLVEARPVYLRGELPEVPFTARGATHRLEALRVEGLSYVYPGTDKGVNDISLTVKRGMFTVIAGRVGSGKTTLLRALLGLLPVQSGEIR